VLTEYIHDPIGLKVNGGIEDSIAAANDRFPACFRIPCKTDAGSKVLLGSVDSRGTHIEFIPQSRVQRQVRPYLPAVFDVGGVVRIICIGNACAEHLVVSLSKSKVISLKRIDGERSR